MDDQLWNGGKAKAYFIGMHDKQNPEAFNYKPRLQHYKDLQDIELAYKDLYRLCAINALDKQRLLNTLINALQISVANKDANSDKEYLDAYKSIAEQLHSSIESGKVKFI